MSYNSTAYNEDYYKSHCGECYERGNGWEEIFAKQAEIITRDFQPKTTLDVGCAAGYLVEGLRDRGVNAYGIDVSDYALSIVREDIKPFCHKQSATEQIKGKYDLITCIEVLEHLESDAIREAIKNMCHATETIIFSSTPFDFGEETHYSVNQSGYWCEEFAANGFFHDLDYDCSYIAVQTMVFRKRNVGVRELVRTYENKFFNLWNQCCILRDKNNLSTARIADLDRGNIEHAQVIYDYEQRIKQLEEQSKNEYEKLEEQSKNEYKKLEEQSKNKYEKLEEQSKNEYEKLKDRHVKLIQAEYEKRDVLCCKHEVLREEKQFLESEFQKCIDEKNSLQGENAAITQKYAEEFAKGIYFYKDMSQAGYLHCLKAAYVYKRHTKKLLKKSLSYWLPVFNPVEYAEINPDVVAKVGNKDEKLLHHFIEYGMNEGRRANYIFDIEVYMRYNRDVVEKWNGKRRECYLHYIENGCKEGRRAI